MIPKTSIMRVVRPTDNLECITNMYMDGLGFELLNEFQGHNGINGSILGHENHPYHFAFTQHMGVEVGSASTKDNLLVFYIPNKHAWVQCCESMLEAGFIRVDSYNVYWNELGRTFEDVDGYRIVLQNDEFGINRS